MWWMFARFPTAGVVTSVKRSGEAVDAGSAGSSGHRELGIVGDGDMPANSGAVDGLAHVSC